MEFFWTWAHVMAMMAAFPALQGTGLVLHVLAGRMEAPQTQAAAKALQPVFRFGSAAVGLGVLVGLWLAAAYGFWRPWLVASYVLAVIAALNGAIIEGGWARRLVAASPDGVASILAEPLPRLANWVGLALWAVLLWLMVAKPGG